VQVRTPRYSEKKTKRETDAKKTKKTGRTKTNNARLRATVFAPADAARTQRLSERLLAAAKAREEAKMQVEGEGQVMNGDGVFSSAWCMSAVS